jgi:hypothetical protein
MITNSWPHIRHLFKEQFDTFAHRWCCPQGGRTDQHDKYELTYIRQTLGTKIGHNRVEIATNEEGEEDSEEFDDNGEDTETAQMPREREKTTISARYNTKSELEADVKPGENVFDFHLEGQPSA